MNVNKFVIFNTASAEIMLCIFATRRNESHQALRRVTCAAVMMLAAAIMDAGYEENVISAKKQT